MKAEVRGDVIDVLLLFSSNMDLLHSLCFSTPDWMVNACAGKENVEILM